MKDADEMRAEMREPRFGGPTMSDPTGPRDGDEQAWNRWSPRLVTDVFKPTPTHYEAFLAGRASVTPNRETIAEALKPGDSDERMDAYYYGFDRTGVGIIDHILSAVAIAGKHYHHTEDWRQNAEDLRPGEIDDEDRIQAAANEAAAVLAFLAVPSTENEAGNVHVK